MPNDVYETPEADLTTNDEPSNVLASRASRLGAFIIDAIVLFVATIPLIIVLVLIFPGIFEQESVTGELLTDLVGGVLAAVIYALIQGRLLVQTGKTIGKKALGIKIVSAATGQLPHKNVIIKRSAFYLLVGLIPFIGSIISLVNVLFIFGNEQKCLHDRIASTKVVVD